jgi:hypothetical protein
MAIAIVLYVIICLLAGLAGSQRRMGFFGTFLLSLVITPLLASLLLIFTRPHQEKAPAETGAKGFPTSPRG